MFLDNKYFVWYHQLIEKRRSTHFVGYGERHHVLPKSLGGSNAGSNLVRLTAREHFVAHQLLVRMTEGDAKRRMVFALKRTVSSKTHVLNSRTFESVREMYAAQLRGVPRSAETKKRISDSLSGFVMPEEAKRKISAALKGIPKPEAFKEQLRGRPRSEETRAKIAEGLKGRSRSEETRLKISETRKRKFAESKQLTLV